MAIAPNSVGSATISTTNPSMIAQLGAAVNQINGRFMVESTNIFAATNAGIINVFGTGWRDQVNAN